MVEKVDKIAGTTGSMATHINHSVSITSEPDAVWVAHRQAAITAALERQGSKRRDHPESADSEAGEDPGSVRSEDALPDSADPATERLSGESERIGSGNWDEDVPFGNHVGYL